MAEAKKRQAVYDPEAQKRWNDKNKERRSYLSSRSSARSFIRNKATIEDLQELRAMIDAMMEELAE